MGEKLLDDLARALAEPVPRSRALKLMGSILVATSFPGAAFARTRRSAPVTKCGFDQNICREFTEQAYCCPSPSWQFFCGRRPGVCIDMCDGPTQFPCTARIPHPESGINGVCCDQRLHKKCEPVGKAATCCYGSPIKCVPMGEAACKTKGGTWAPSERWKPQCVPCLGTMCGPNKKVPVDDPLGRARWTCCKPPAKCKKGVCRCKDGSESCDEKCCKRGEKCSDCYEVSFRVGGTLVGRKCCKDGICCGDKCCQSDDYCSYYRGKSVCCPRARTFNLSRSGTSFCCPAGTVVTKWGCCPRSDPDCCPPTDVNGNPVSCGANICVKGKCVKP